MATKKTKAKKRKKLIRTAASKKPKKNKKRAPTKARKKVSAPQGRPKKAAKRRAAPKRKKTTNTQAVVPPPKTFAQKVRDGDAGTLVWYRVGDDVVCGELRGRGSAGFVAILRNRDIGGVGEGNVFETAEQARAAL